VRAAQPAPGPRDECIVDEQGAVAVEQHRAQKSGENRVAARRGIKFLGMHLPQTLAELARSRNLVAGHHLIDLIHQLLAHGLQAVEAESGPAGGRRGQT
jgi:hypothetical protein